MSFATMLANKLKENGMTKAELARRIDVADTTVGRYVKGTMMPRPLILNRIAKVFKCSVYDLYKHF